MIQKFQNPSGRLKINISPEQLAKWEKEATAVPGTNTNSNVTVTLGKKLLKDKQDVKRQTRRANRRIATENANRGYLRYQKGLQDKQYGITHTEPTQQLSDAYAAAHGEIRDGNQAWLNNAMAGWGLHSGLGLMTNVSDQWRATPSFARFVGRDTPLAMAMAGNFAAAPHTALFGLGTSMLGGYAGGKIGEEFGNKEAGLIIGSFAAPIGFSLFNKAIQPTVARTFANEFGTSYGYSQALRVPSFITTLTKGGVKEYPKVKINPETGDLSVTLVEKGKLRTYGGDEEYAPSEIGRAQAVSKYAGAPDESTPFYKKNENGTYQYDAELTPYNLFGLFRERHPEISIRLATRHGYDVHGDFIGNNGGNVGIRYDGQFLAPDGTSFNRYMMRDVWDLQPLGSLFNQAGKYINDKLFSFGGTAMDKTTSLLGELVGNKVGKFIWNTGDKLLTTMKNIGNTPWINREVGRMVGAKPFTLEHPFAVKTSVAKSGDVGDYFLKGNTMNLFTNEQVPGARYSTPFEVSLDLPFNFNFALRNLTYPLYNFEHNKNRAESAIEE